MRIIDPPPHILEIECTNCGHKLGWHHAIVKIDGKIRICYGIGCMCEKCE
jgi:hypothetical protein